MWRLSLVTYLGPLCIPLYRNGVFTGVSDMLFPTRMSISAYYPLLPMCPVNSSSSFRSLSQKNPRLVVMSKTWSQPVWVWFLALPFISDLESDLTIFFASVSPYIEWAFVRITVHHIMIIQQMLALRALGYVLHCTAIISLLILPSLNYSSFSVGFLCVFVLTRFTKHRL